MKLRSLLVVVLVGCGGGSQGELDARTEPAVCKANLEAAIDRTCMQPTDCVLVASADCCGTVMIAIRAGTQTGFASVESAYETCLACPPLGCQHADLAEDGMTPQSGQAIVATCDANRCASAVR